jgi:hypothetical protein
MDLLFGELLWSGITSGLVGRGGGVGEKFCGLCSLLDDGRDEGEQLRGSSFWNVGREFVGEYFDGDCSFRGLPHGRVVGGLVRPLVLGESYLPLSPFEDEGFGEGECRSQSLLDLDEDGLGVGDLPLSSLLREEDGRGLSESPRWSSAFRDLTVVVL